MSMTTFVVSKPISSIFSANESENIKYIVPKYQREYEWGGREREELFNDLIDNGKNYFLGSSIILDRSGTKERYELIDGQQRLTSLSILLAALYHRLIEIRHHLLSDKDLANQLGDDPVIEVVTTVTNLEHQLIHNQQAALTLQAEKHNDDDYRAVLGEAGLLKNVQPLPYMRNRQIARAYRQYTELLNVYSSTSAPVIEQFNELNKLLNIINTIELVQIVVNNSADAYVLFRSLNDRGKSLSAIDLIKNCLLANAGADVDKCYAGWKYVLETIDNDNDNNPTLQDRFLRYYYDAFRNEITKYDNSLSKTDFPNGKKLITLYEQSIEKIGWDKTLHGSGSLTGLIVASEIYSCLVSRLNNQHNDLWRKYVGDDDRTISFALQSLLHVKGSMADILLLNVFANREKLQLSNDDLAEIIRLLTVFFVRRNLTDSPANNAVERIITKITADISGLKSTAVVDQVRFELKDAFQDPQSFSQRLRGNIYSDNRDMTKFILMSLAQRDNTPSTTHVSWDATKKDEWTVEHILPQTPSDSLLHDFSGNNSEIIANYEEDYLHKLGNLTLLTRGHNSSLKNESLAEKLNHDYGDGDLGYICDLNINKDVCDHQGKGWHPEDIDQRTERLAQMAEKLFSWEKPE